MAAGGKRVAITNCSGCGEVLESRLHAHDLSLSDRVEREENGKRYRSSQIVIHAVLCDECSARLRAVIEAELVGDEWNRIKEGD